MDIDERRRNTVKMLENGWIQKWNILGRIWVPPNNREKEYIGDYSLVAPIKAIYDAGKHGELE